MKNHIVTLALLGLAVTFGIGNTAQARTRNMDEARIDRFILRNDTERVVRFDRVEARHDKSTYTDKSMRSEIRALAIRSDRAERDEIIERGDVAERNANRERYALRSDLVERDWGIRKQLDAMRYLDRGET